MTEKQIDSSKESLGEKEIYIDESSVVDLVLKRCGHGTAEDIPPDVEFISETINQMSLEEALVILQEAVQQHKGDMNFPSETYETIQLLLEKPKPFDCKLEAALIAFHSPYPEVRAVTDPFDDVDMPVETIRAYFLGFLWTIVGVGVNAFFSRRMPSVKITSSVVQLLLYPSGKLVEFLPAWSVFGHSLNPGPWNYKEQMLATIIFNVASSGVYVTSNNIVQKLEIFYGNKWVDFGYQVLLALCTQFLGFGFAGFLRRFVVYPSRAMWPTVLPTLAMNRALLTPEKRENLNGWTISRYKFFFLCFAGMFCYFWLPNYLFTAMSYFNWINWIAPNNFNLAAICGTKNGLGLNPIPTFDWNVIDHNHVLTIPFFSQLNQIIGTFIAFFCIIAVYYSNYKWTAYLPINTNKLYTNRGERFVVTKVLTGNLLDTEKYRNYSPPYYSAANLVVYGASIALYPFSFIYTFVSEWGSISHSGKLAWGSLKSWRGSNYKGFNDPHSRMMSKYKEVPEWCFVVILVISIVLGILCVKLYPTDTPVWGIFFAVGINFAFLIPLTLIYSITGFQFGLNVLVELIVGYALPGNGVALMIIKAIGYNVDGQAQTYVFDQKLAHYAKIPPRAVFKGQLTAILIQVFVGLGVVNWSISNVDKYCQSDQPQRFSCPGENTFFSSSVVWGVIGPARVFEDLYPILKWCFLIGALLTIPCLLLKRYIPNFQPTLIIGSMRVFAPYNLSYYLPGFTVSFVFMYYIKRRFTQWWEKYNYLLTSGFGTGVALSAIIIFFAVEYHGKTVTWWGNTVSSQGIEGGIGRKTLLSVSDLADGYFGPSPSQFA